MIMQKPKHDSGIAEWQLFCEPIKGALLDASLQPFLQALSTLGDIRLVTNTESIPVLHELQASVCYLSWTIFLKTTASYQQIREIAQRYQSWLSISIMCLTTENVVTYPVGHRCDLESNGYDNTLIFSHGDYEVLRNELSGLAQHYHLCREYAVNTNAENIQQLGEHWQQLGQAIDQIQQTVLHQRLWPLSQMVIQLADAVTEQIPTTIQKTLILHTKGDYLALDRQIMAALWPNLVVMLTNIVMRLAQQEQDLAKPSSSIQDLTLSFYQAGDSIQMMITDNASCAVPGYGKMIHAVDFIQDARALLATPRYETNSHHSPWTEKRLQDNVQQYAELAIQDETHIDIKMGWPLTQVEMKGFVVKTGEHRYIVPHTTANIMLAVKPDEIASIADQPALYCYQEHYIQVITLAVLVNEAEMAAITTTQNLCILLVDKQPIALALDPTTNTTEKPYYIQSLQPHHKTIAGIYGAHITSTGQVQLMLDVAMLIRAYRQRQNDGNNA